MPISGETVMIRHRPGALFGSSDDNVSAKIDPLGNVVPTSAMVAARRRLQEGAIIMISA